MRRRRKNGYFVNNSSAGVVPGGIAHASQFQRCRWRGESRGSSLGLKSLVARWFGGHLSPGHNRHLPDYKFRTFFLGLFGD
jgi:hypothetical protein